MAYSVKEIFYTLQGEGNHSGRPAVFCRFTGCNLWSGDERTRSAAVCQFCDTDFNGITGQNGGKFFTPSHLADEVFKHWPQSSAEPYLVCTGGEPLLQLDEILIEAFKKKGFTVAVETNGTIKTPEGLDWICVSPKASTRLVVTSGDELKLVFPQEGVLPEAYEHLNFKYFYLQPMDNSNLSNNVDEAVQYCLRNPKWHLSLQSHKTLNID